MRRFLAVLALLPLLVAAVVAIDTCAVQHCVRLALIMTGGPALAPEPTATEDPTTITTASATTIGAVGTLTTTSTASTTAEAATSTASTTAEAATSTTTANPTSTTPVLASIQWITETLAPQPYGNSEAQSVVIGNKLYSFGGFDSTRPCCTPTRRAYAYDPIANTWDVIRDLPFTPNGTRADNTTFGGVTHAGVTTDGTFAYFAGGYTSDSTGNGQTFNSVEVWRYDPTSGGGTYTRLPDLPKPRAAGMLAYVDRGTQGRELHYIGGTYRTNSTKVDVGDHWSLNLDALNAYLANTASAPRPSWKKCKPLPNPRQHAASVVYAGKIYYIGGEHEHDADLVAQSDVHAYDPQTDSWAFVTSIPYPKTTDPRAMGRNHAAFTTLVLDNLLLLVGGQTYHRVAIDRVDAYSFDSGQWLRLPSLPRNNHSAVGAVLKDKGGVPFIIISTGVNRKESVKGILVYQ